jgi:hypothetical protein
VSRSGLKGTVNIEWLIEDQAFSQSYYLAPRLSPFPRRYARLATHRSLRKIELLSGEGVGRGVGGAKSYNAEKACSSINHSILWMGGSRVTFDPDESKIQWVPSQGYILTSL